MSFELFLPSSQPFEIRTLTRVTADRNIIIVGANGAGKTRLAAWLDLSSELSGKTHRVSAQKNLSMPGQVSTLPVDQALRQLMYGIDSGMEANASIYKRGHRFSNMPATGLLSDFGHLLCYLYSEQAQSAVDYRQKSLEHSGKEKLEVPPTALDKVKNLWEKILPHRKIIVKSQQIAATAGSSTEYQGSEMSDGERVIFYLIGQCLAAPAGHTIVIDEPELHLHKSIQVNLWSAIEEMRPDCLFVYLTHDVEFAASMAASQKIWLKSFDGEDWSWEFIQTPDSIPEALLLEILGSRRRVLAVEGVKGGKDSTLYQLLFPEFLVLPVNGCSNVIDIVKNLNSKNASQFHHLRAIGLIDRDRRNAAEIEALKKHGIFTLNVAEVENLFCVEGVIRAVSKKLHRDPDADFCSVKEHVFGRFSKEIETQASLHTTSEIKYQLNYFNDKATGKEAINAELNRLAAAIDTNSIYDSIKTEFDSIVQNTDYNRLLEKYNRKSIADTVAPALDLAKGTLMDLVIRMMKSHESQEIRSALIPYFSDFIDATRESRENG